MEPIAAAELDLRYVNENLVFTEPYVVMRAIDYRGHHYEYGLKTTEHISLSEEHYFYLTQMPFDDPYLNISLRIIGPGDDIITYDVPKNWQMEGRG